MKRVQGNPHYGAKELEAMPTLSEGQADDLKYEEGEPGQRRLRLWLSRCGLADGEPFRRTVTVEVRDPRVDNGEWRIRYRYDGDHPMTILKEET